MFCTDNGKRTRASSKETLGSHVTCSARCTRQAEKNKGFKSGSESEQQRWSQTSTLKARSGRFPRKTGVSSLPPAHGSDPG